MKILALFLLSPLIAEFLLGNLSIASLPYLLSLAPLYGGGAILIREVARRAGLGWRGIALLALAYAVLEETVVTQSLFNPDYAGQRLLDYGWIPGLGMSAWWTVFVITIHSVWSICVPIALVESAARSRDPWLGRIGIGIWALVYAIGVAMTTMFNPSPYPLSVTQLIGSIVAVAGLVVAALLARRRQHPVTARLKAAPGPWPMFWVSLGGTSAFWLLTMAVPAAPVWLTLSGYSALTAAGIILISRWSRCAGWGWTQVFALAAGAVVTYAWHGFVQPPTEPAPAAVDLIGNAVFALVAVVLIAGFGLRLRRTARTAQAAAALSQP